MNRQEQEANKLLLVPKAGSTRILVKLIPIETKFQQAGSLIMPTNVEGNGDMTKRCEVVYIGRRAQEEYPDMKPGDIICKAQGNGHMIKIGSHEMWSITIADVIAYYSKEDYDAYLKSSLKLDNSLAAG